MEIDKDTALKGIVLLVVFWAENIIENRSNDNNSSNYQLLKMAEDEILFDDVYELCEVIGK